METLVGAGGGGGGEAGGRKGGGGLPSGNPFIPPVDSPGVCYLLAPGISLFWPRFKRSAVGVVVGWPFGRR